MLCVILKVTSDKNCSRRRDVAYWIETTNQHSRVEIEGVKKTVRKVIKLLYSWGRWNISFFFVSVNLFKRYLSQPTEFYTSIYMSILQTNRHAYLDIQTHNTNQRWASNVQHPFNKTPMAFARAGKALFPLAHNICSLSLFVAQLGGTIATSSLDVRKLHEIDSSW